MTPVIALLAKYGPMFYSMGEKYGYPRIYRRVREALRREELNLNQGQRESVESVVKESLRAPTTMIRRVLNSKETMDALEKLAPLIDQMPKDRTVSGVKAIGEVLLGRSNGGKVADLFVKIFKDSHDKVTREKR